MRLYSSRGRGARTREREGEKERERERERKRERERESLRKREVERERERPNRDGDYVNLINSGELLQCNWNARGELILKNEYGYNDVKQGNQNVIKSRNVQECKCNFQNTKQSGST